MIYRSILLTALKNRVYPPVIKLEALIIIFVGVMSDNGIVTFSAAEVKIHQGP